MRDLTETPACHLSQGGSNAVNAEEKKGETA
jgi:hypothetical protein